MEWECSKRKIILRQPRREKMITMMVMVIITKLARPHRSLEAAELPKNKSSKIRRKTLEPMEVLDAKTLKISSLSPKR